MADDTTVRTAQDRSRINLGQEHEVRYWTKALDCTEEQLRAAIQQVGSSADKVRAAIAKRA